MFECQPESIAAALGVVKPETPSRAIVEFDE